MTREQLERADPAEPRELAALQTNIRPLRREIGGLLAERSPADLRTALRMAVLASPLARPARALHRRVRGRG